MEIASAAQIDERKTDIQLRSETTWNKQLIGWIVLLNKVGIATLFQWFANAGNLGENLVMQGTGPLDLNVKLKRLIETVDAANILTEPLTASIKSLVTLAASEIDCDEASVLVRDGDEGDLRFLIAIGRVADQLLNIRVPAGKGIAGFVLSSGQPMAIADAGEDESFYAEVDKETGYSTQTILATPLRHGGEIIGVLEFINRRGEPPYVPYTPEEMDRAAGFADAIASLVNAYQSAKLFRDLGERMLSSEDPDAASIREWLHDVRTSSEHKEMMDIALLIRELTSRGEAERVLAKEIFEAVIRFADSSDSAPYLA